MKDYLISVVSPLLIDPQSLKISETKDDTGTLLLVNVSKSDMGRVLGKQGDTIKAIRTLIYAAGAMIKESVRVKILEPQQK